MTKSSPGLEAWTKEKRRVGFLLSSVVAALFFALVTFMAFWPEALTRPVYREIVSLGLAATLAFLLLTFLVMAGYVRWRERRERGAS